MSDKTNEQKSKQQSEQDFDESLGVEQLPQAELEASPGDGDQQSSNLDVDEAGVATTDASTSNRKQNQK